MNASSIRAGTICFDREQQTRWTKGFFFGESPFSSSTPLLLCQASLCALITAILNRFLSPLGQSVFVSQIIAGVLLGPSILGTNAVLRDLLFPVSSFYIIDTFAYFGIMFFLFIVGVKTDLSLIQKSGKKAVAIGFSTFAVPLLFNSILGKLITNSVPMEPRLHRSLIWVASFQAVSSFHAIVCLLADLKLMSSDLGRLAISSSMISGLCSLFWTLIVFTGKQTVHIKEHTFLLIILFLGFMILFAVCIFRPIVRRMIKESKGKAVKESHVLAIFVSVLGSAMYGEYFGQHFIFGPIILGMVIPDGPPLGSALVNKLDLFITSIILPIFFVVSAATIDFSAITLRSFVIVEFLACFALLWKIAGVLLPLIFWKMPLSDAIYLGIILSNQGIMEVLMLERAKAIELIDKESYSIMVLSISIFTGILAPIVKFSYKPSKKYIAGEWATIQHADPNMELRVLACLHYPEHTPSIINLFEVSYPHPQAPICFYVVHLIELAGRSAPVLVAHHPGLRNPSHSNESDHIINALRFFELENRGHATVYPFTSISPYASMHHDVCSLAAERRASLVIALFHKHPVIHATDVDTNAIRAVNQNIIKESPCSVGILIDRGSMICSATSMLQAELYRVGVLFFGGPDDREALSYARRMAKHPNVHLTLVRFVEDNTGATYSYEIELDLDLINKFRDVEQMQNRRCFYQEEMVTDSVGVISVVRSMQSCFDMILVGRRHEDNSPLLAGLLDWNEFPELGVVGDMLYSLDSECKTSLLVVQQASSGEEYLDDPKALSARQGPAAVMEMPLGGLRQVSSAVSLNDPRALSVRQGSSVVMGMPSNDCRVWPQSSLAM